MTGVSTWNGANADWLTKADWTVSNGGSSPPAVSDTAVINSGTVTVGSAESDNVGSLVLSADARIDIAGALNIGGGQATDPSNTLGGAGSAITVHDGGALAAGSYVTSATGTVDLASNGAYLWDGSGSTQTVDMGGQAGTLFSDNSAFGGTITDFGSGDNIIHVGGTVTSVDVSLHSATFNVTGSPLGNQFTVNFSDSVNTADFVITNGQIGTTQIVCFATGARIRTVRGDVPVETLKVGDLAVTASGERRPIVWLGHRTLSRETASDFRAAWPIRIAAGAFGDDLPSRDLHLSPGHAVCINVVDEVFIPICRLVNGATITPVDVEEVTYWHVELESHDVLIANGLPAESYIDCDNRDWFLAADGAVGPDRAPATWADYCRPFFYDGPVVEAVRSRLRARAEVLGWTTTQDMDMHLIVDGRRVDPDIDSGVARFLFPAEARDVQLVSETSVPAQWSAGTDTRELGVAVTGLQIGDAFQCGRDIPIDHPLLVKGFHPMETVGEASWRWTNGRLEIPSPLWADCQSHVILRVAFRADGWVSRWVAPTKTQTDARPRPEIAAPNIIPLRVAQPRRRSRG